VMRRPGRRCRFGWELAAPGGNLPRNAADGIGEKTMRCGLAT
jgi:hypothetical protein